MLINTLVGLFCTFISKQPIILSQCGHDQKKSITDAIAKNLPRLKTFLCWNHIQQDIKRWVRSHRASKAGEIAVYLDNITSLLQSNSLEEYKDQLLTYVPKWSQPFLQYCMSTVNVVIKHLGWWELQQFQID